MLDFVLHWIETALFRCYTSGWGGGLVGGCGVFVHYPLGLGFFEGWSVSFLCLFSVEFL